MPPATYITPSMAATDGKRVGVGMAGLVTQLAARAGVRSTSMAPKKHSAARRGVMLGIGFLRRLRAVFVTERALYRYERIFALLSVDGVTI
jgi:hypothetical protein